MSVTSSSPTAFDIESVRGDLENRNFQEYPPCNQCGARDVEEKLVASDGSRIVECAVCKLWFTSPRLEEVKWEAFLTDSDSRRNKKLTDNRLRHGVALEKNISKQPLDWRRRKRRAHKRLLRELKRWTDIPINSIHEVGCGVGFFLEDMKRLGMEATGNDLNGYACQVMKEKMGLEVWNCNFSEINFSQESKDIIVMSDYIEHTYHPMQDIKEAFRVMNKNGVIYIQTFIIDSDPFNKMGPHWNMLHWNHVYHFSTQSLVRMIESAGFTVRHVLPKISRGMISVVAQKTLAA
jgi:2-polyprenyl-3-methyl-5-hydroxy-6-metoxy-1,4-benzoquinol methylase